ncbi:MAG: hypothetical protein ABIL58_13775 [Pseudomonadota bacterium]
MLAVPIRYLFIYVVDRDFGFAPNPFHAYCTLATCKARLRNSANVGDWILGVGGSRLNATGKCIYLMKVTEILTFDEYWSDSRFRLKRPIRNGSLVMLVGDNIYHQNCKNKSWIQEDSHHSNPDGSMNLTNLNRDTSSHKVLISSFFLYFGSSAPIIDLNSIGYSNGIGYSKKPLTDNRIESFITGILNEYREEINTVIADPFNFEIAYSRVDQGSGRIHK